MRKGMEGMIVNDGYIELPIAASKLRQIQSKLEKQSAKWKEGKNDLATQSIKIAGVLAEACSGSGFNLHIEGHGDEGRPISKMVFTYTEGGWYDDALNGQRYQYAVELKKGKLVLTSARAWLKPEAKRYAAHLKDYKEKKTEWGAVPEQ